MMYFVFDLYLMKALISDVQGKKEMLKCAKQSFRKAPTDIKSRLEDMILGQGSARSELMQRRKGIAVYYVKYVILFKSSKLDNYFIISRAYFCH